MRMLYVIILVIFPYNGECQLLGGLTDGLTNTVKAVGKGATGTVDALGNLVKGAKDKIEDTVENLTTKCCPDVGCFELNATFFHPIYRPINVPPDCPDKIDARFLLF